MSNENAPSPFNPLPDKKTIADPIEPVDASSTLSGHSEGVGSFTLSYDVFLCHNSQDKDEVRKLDAALKDMHLRTWLDEDQLIPGQSWQDALEKQISTIGAAVVCIGDAGHGPWQKEELKAFIRQFVKRKVPVIPVILSTCQGDPELPVFLAGFHGVDMRKDIPDPLDLLKKGITHQNPSQIQVRPPQKSWTKRIFAKISVPIYFVIMGLVVIAIALFLSRCMCTPLRISNWVLQSDLEEAEGRAVDTDTLLLTWKCVGDHQDVEIWLENVQTNTCTPSFKTSGTQEALKLTVNDYRAVLKVREREGINRVRACMKTPCGIIFSQELDLYVGITVVLLATDPLQIDVFTQIDNSTAALPHYSVRGAIITWEKKSTKSGDGGFSLLLEEGYFQNPRAKVKLEKPLTQKEWQNLDFAYFGERSNPLDNWRVRVSRMIHPNLTGDVMRR